MIVYRCTLKKWSKDLSGRGAYLHGGRWNSPGKAVIYAAENNVLAALEVSLRIPLEFISKDYVMVPIELPDAVPIYKPKLSKNWHLNVDVTRSIGNDFLRKGKDLIMKVPSALVSDSFNYLVNPNHPIAKKIKLQEPRTILFDKRLMNLMRSKE